MTEDGEQYREAAQECVRAAYKFTDDADAAAILLVMAQSFIELVAPAIETKKQSDQIADLTTEDSVKIASVTPEAKEAAREVATDPILDLSNTGPDFPWWAFI